MSIALANRVERAHERIEELERSFSDLLTRFASLTHADHGPELEKLRGEIQALKMRMGKKFVQ